MGVGEKGKVVGFGWKLGDRLLTEDRHQPRRLVLMNLVTPEELKEYEVGWCC